MTTIAHNPKRKVFLIDDHPLVREWLTNLINQQPDLVVCGETATAKEAIEVAAARQPDVVILDISLSDSSGIDLIRALCRTCPGVRVLVFSMHDESLYAQRALRAGAKGYLMKREATQKLIEAIRRVLTGQFWVSEAITQAITAQFVGGKATAPNGLLNLLSDRELIVFEMLGQGLATRQIAQALRVSIKTVQAHCSHIKEKLRLHGATQLVREAVRHHEIQTGAVPGPGHDQQDPSA